VLASLAAWCMPALSFPDKYDEYFESATEQFLPGVDPVWIKAQCYQESRLKADAVSPVGAQGLCQFMPGTWKDVSAAGIVPANAVFNPEYSVHASAYYMANLQRFWSAKRPWIDRWRLSQASYNAGAGHLVKAQKLCGGGNLYKDIIACLPDVTGHHSRETITYVDRIDRYYWQMKVS